MVNVLFLVFLIELEHYTRASSGVTAISLFTIAWLLLAFIAEFFTIPNIMLLSTQGTSASTLIDALSTAFWTRGITFV